MASTPLFPRLVSSAMKAPASATAAAACGSGDNQDQAAAAAAFDGYADAVIPALSGHWQSGPDTRER